MRPHRLDIPSLSPLRCQPFYLDRFHSSSIVILVTDVLNIHSNTPTTMLIAVVQHLLHTACLLLRLNSLPPHRVDILSLLSPLRSQLFYRVPMSGDARPFRHRTSVSLWRTNPSCSSCQRSSMLLRRVSTLSSFVATSTVSVHASTYLWRSRDRASSREKDGPSTVSRVMAGAGPASAPPSPKTLRLERRRALRLERRRACCVVCAAELVWGKVEPRDLRDGIWAALDGWKGKCTGSNDGFQWMH